MDEPGAESGMNGEAIPIVEVGTSIGVRKLFIYFVLEFFRFLLIFLTLNLIHEIHLDI